MMLDYDTKLRKGYYDVIRGNVLVDNSEIPVVDEKLDSEITTHDVYIKLSVQSVAQQNNKKYFAANVDLNIDIVQITASVGGKLVVDDVADQIYSLLFPTKNQVAAVLETPLRLSLAYLQNSITEPMREHPKGFLTIKTLTFFNRIIQDA